MIGCECEIRTYFAQRSANLPLRLDTIPSRDSVKVSSAKADERSIRCLMIAGAEVGVGERRCVSG
jgi:hypothetical protein